MAGDWIKMRTDLTHDPDVISISQMTGLDEFAVVGRLHRFWSWVDANSDTGIITGVHPDWIDKFLDAPDFAEAMVATGWLIVSAPDCFSIPKFDRWMGESAKKRLQRGASHHANNAEDGAGSRHRKNRQRKADRAYTTSKEYLAYLETEHWQKTRASALERAGGRCQLCNTNRRLQVHHRTYERLGSELPGDLTVLCRRCHARHHGKPENPEPDGHVGNGVCTDQQN